jgi:hypothetical protein
MSADLRQRLRQQRSRTLVRAWEYRQRRNAHGIWFRLRRLLTEASEAYLISTEDAHALLSGGYRAESVGSELEPPKLIVFATAERIADLPSARPVPVRLCGELLAAECLAMTRFFPG